MARVSLHWNVLPEMVPEALREVAAAVKGWDFYLAGGTALALRLGHRVSVDLDLFSPSFTEPDVLAAELGNRIPGLKVGLIDRRTLYIALRGVPVSFFGYEYPLLEPPSQVEADIPPIAGIGDIGAMKLAAIASRGSRKDFVDLWAVIAGGRALSGLLELFSRKFDARDIGHVVRSLTYFDDADEEPPLRLLVNVPWERIKGDMRRWVEELLSEE